MADFNMISGNGAHGPNGTNGVTGGAGAQGVDAQCHWDGDDPATTGGAGSSGTSAADGANGGNAPPPNDLVIRLHDLIGTIQALNQGGVGGNGGNGGTGGTGGPGGDGGNASGCESSENGGRGGAGARGGDGGNGGRGADGGDIYVLYSGSILNGEFEGEYWAPAAPPVEPAAAEPADWAAGAAAMVRETPRVARARTETPASRALTDGLQAEILL